MYLEGHVFQQGPSDVLKYAVDFTFARRWAADYDFTIGATIRPEDSTGLQYTASAGHTAEHEPRWPRTAGLTVRDGSITWTAEAQSTSSLETTVSTVAWSADAGLNVANDSISGQLATAEISGGIDGTTYRVQAHCVYADGQEKTATFFVRVHERTIRA